MRRIEDINFDKIDFEPYKKDIEELKEMVNELWQDEEIRKIYVRQQISDIEKDFKDIKEYYVDIAQKTQSNWNSLREYYKRKTEETKDSTALYDKWTKYSSVVDKINKLEKEGIK